MIKHIKNKKGVGVFEATLIICLFISVQSYIFIIAPQLEKKNEMITKYSPNELYENKFSEIKPLSTKDYVVKVENSEIANEKYIKIRFFIDDFKREYVYVVQKRDDDSFEIIRKYENFEPLK